MMMCTLPSTTILLYNILYLLMVPAAAVRE